jgi:steroid 5-alpha reductase family enzyme
MQGFLVLLAVALVASACGFKRYVWFISIGYGAAVAAIGVALLVMFGARSGVASALQALLLVVYGCRLSGYLAYRELRSRSYNQKMKGEVKGNDSVTMGVRFAIWGSAALLYACQTSPVLFRMAAGGRTDAFLVVGLCVSVFGLAFETTADIQKNAAKRKNPRRFVDTGLFRIVRCPNYLGEMLFWTGTFVSGIGVYAGVAQWLAALLGYVGIIYVMFGGARRLEMRQNRSYGKDPAYQRYVRTTPIMLPFVPLYSVEKYTWLVA